MLFDAYNLQLFPSTTKPRLSELECDLQIVHPRQGDCEASACRTKWSVIQSFAVFT